MAWITMLLGREFEAGDLEEVAGCVRSDRNNAGRVGVEFAVDNDECVLGRVE